VRGSALNEQDGGAVRFLYSLGRGGIPPKPPFRHALAGTILFSAEFEAVFCKAKCATKRDVALDPPNPFAGNAKELPKDSFTKLFKLVIIIVSRKKPLYYILYTIMLYN